MIAFPVIAFFILGPPHWQIESIKFAPIKCGLLTTSALSSAALLRLYPTCPDEDFVFPRTDAV